MEIGIKYCGGCNPRYDRGSVVSFLKKEFNYNFETAKKEKIYDVIVVLCGCTSCCAEHGELKDRFGRVLVTSENDYKRIKDLINNTRVLINTDQS